MAFSFGVRAHLFLLWATAELSVIAITLKRVIDRNFGTFLQLV